MRLVSPYRFVKFALARLRFAYDVRNAGVDTVALGRRVFALIQEVVYFVKFELLAQSLMRARLFRLFCKRFELAFEFRGNIDYTRNVVARSVEFTHGFKPFSLGFGNTYSLFEYGTAIFGFTRKYFGNLTLSDYGVTLFAYAAFVQTIDYPAFTINAKDGSEFTVDPTVSLKMTDGNAPKVFKKYRKELNDIINGTLFNYVKDAFRIQLNKYTTDQIVSNRDMVERAIESQLSKALAKEHFHLEQLTSGLKYPNSIVEAVNQKNMMRFGLHAQP